MASPLCDDLRRCGTSPARLGHQRYRRPIHEFNEGELELSPEVHRILVAEDATFELHEHAPLVSFEELKSTLPFDPAQMVKALAFCLPSGSYALVAMRAAERADYKRIADALGIRRADLKPAAPQDLAADLDMQVGGVAPFPVAGAHVLLDENAAALPLVFCGTGRNNSTLELSGRELVRISQGKIGRYTKPATEQAQ
jgi:Cys-tRNA(Pro)/Cys-tRNA(Cys) deacylase